MNTNQPRSTSVWGLFLVGLVLVLVSAGVTYAYYALVKIPDLTAEIQNLRTYTTAAETDTSSTTVSTPVAVSTTTSSTYTDRDFGFSFTLPAGYTLMRDTLAEGLAGAQVTLGKKDEDSELVSENSYLTVTVLESDTRTLSQMQSDLGQSDIIDSSDITVDGQPAIKATLGGFSGGYAVISTNQSYSVHFNWYPSDASDLLNTVVSSFTFPRS